MDSLKYKQDNVEVNVHKKLQHRNISLISCNFYQCIHENKKKYEIFHQLGVSVHNWVKETTGMLSLNQVLGIINLFSNLFVDTKITIHLHTDKTKI